MPDEIVFQSQGSRTGFGSTALMTLVVLGVFGSISVGIVAFIVPKMVGSPWIYAATFVGSIGFGWWVMRHDHARIVVSRREGQLRVAVHGPAVALDVAVPAKSEHWVSFFRFPAKHGGGEAVRYSVIVIAEGGRKLGFKLMAGPRGSEPADWPVRDHDLPDGEDVFTCPGIRGLVDVLAGKTAGGSEAAV